MTRCRRTPSSASSQTPGRGNHSAREACLEVGCAALRSARWSSRRGTALPGRPGPEPRDAPPRRLQGPSSLGCRTVWESGRVTTEVSKALPRLLRSDRPPIRTPPHDGPTECRATGPPDGVSGRPAPVDAPFPPPPSPLLPSPSTLAVANMLRAVGFHSESPTLTGAPEALLSVLSCSPAGHVFLRHIVLQSWTVPWLSGSPSLSLSLSLSECFSRGHQSCVLVSQKLAPDVKHMM